MTPTISRHPGELPFRAWARLAREMADTDRNSPASAALLEQVRDGIVFIRREGGGKLWTGFVALWSDEANAFSAELRCPRTTRNDEPMPAIELVPVRLGDHLDDETFLRGLRVRLTSVAPYDPEGLPDFPEWLWHCDGAYERFNLLFEDGRLVLPPGWERRGPRIGPIFCSTPILRLMNGYGRMGLMATDGTLTVPCNYAYLSEPDGWGKIVVCEASRDRMPDHKSRCDFIDGQGRRTNPDGVKVIPSSLRFGKATAVADPDDGSGRTGIITADGRVIGGIRWSKVGQFRDKLAVVQDPVTKLLGYINESGIVAIQPALVEAHSFERNLAIASPAGSDGQLGLIDRSGRFVAAPVWHGLTWFIGRYFEVTTKDGAIGLIDDQGNIVIEPHQLTPEEQAQIKKSCNYIRAHPFTLELGRMFKARIDAALAGADTLAPLAGMFSPSGAKDIELQASGLLWRPVTVVADYQTETLGLEIKAGDTGHIGWSYPVTGSIFNLAIEAPIERLPTLPHGAVGVPWRCLRLT